MPRPRSTSRRSDVKGKRSSLACPQYRHLHRDQAHSRLTSAITAPQTPRWRPPAPGDCAFQALTGTRRAALLGTCARARAPRRHAPSTVVDWYGGQRKRLWVFSRTALWYTPGWTPVAIRFVVVRDPEGNLQ